MACKYRLNKIKQIVLSLHNGVTTYTYDTSSYENSVNITETGITLSFTIEDNTNYRRLIAGIWDITLTMADGTTETYIGAECSGFSKPTIESYKYEYVINKYGNQIYHNRV